MADTVWKMEETNIKLLTEITSAKLSHRQQYSDIFSFLRPMYVKTSIHCSGKIHNFYYGAVRITTYWWYTGIKYVIISHAKE